MINKAGTKLQYYRDGKILRKLQAEHQIRSTKDQYFERPPEKVMFVCYGNICRSPFAEYLWNARASGRWLNGNVAISAGFHPLDGRTTPDWAIDLAAEYGVNLAHHRSRDLTNAMVESADAIFVMDRKNYREFIGQFPRAKNKVYFLGLFADSPWAEIDDPYGVTQDKARICYHRIVLSIKGVVKRLPEFGSNESSIQIHLNSQSRYDSTTNP
jgi:protein-tyrosine phosphatase